MKGNPALLTVLLCAGGVFASPAAFADRGSFRGAHPIPKERPGSFCHIDAPHTHTYTPDPESSDAYVEHADAGLVQLEFVGDPTGLGYEGPIFAYGEAHPMRFKGGSGSTEAQCQIQGPHFHLHQPFDLSKFEDHEGTYYFGSYQAAMRERRTQEKLRRAQEKQLAKEERRLAAQARRASASESTRRAKRRASSSPADANPTPVATTPNPPAKTTTPAKTKTPAKKKKRRFQSWMDRRRGR